MWSLYFFQIVDANRIAVPFACEEYFDKISDNAKLFQFSGATFRMHRQSLVRLTFMLSARNVIGLPKAFCEAREGEMIKTMAHVAIRIAVLKTPYKDLVKSRA